MLEASLRCAKTEPHISVRVHKNSRPDLVDAMCRLQLEGFGQATMYCDDTLIPALIRSGLSPALAAAYANDGCTEVILDGASTIDFAQVEAVKCVELTLGNGDEPPLPGDPVAHYWTRHGAKTEWHTACGLGYRSGDPEGFETYDDLYTAFLAQYRYQTVRTLERQFEWLCLHRRVGTSSPLLNGTFMSMLDSARDIQRGGLPHNVVMLFSGSIPTAADSLAALKKEVYEDKKYTLAEVITALRANFEGWGELRAALLAAPKFGNDDDYTDLIAADIAKTVLRMGQRILRDAERGHLAGADMLYVRAGGILDGRYSRRAALDRPDRRALFAGARTRQKRPDRGDKLRREGSALRGVRRLAGPDFAFTHYCAAQLRRSRHYESAVRRPPRTAVICL